jgi:LytS/YehU family sensor histidine kinase
MQPEHRNRCVVPCGIQLLIENAFKHNVVHSESPLRIEIIFSDSHIVVRNNRQPKLSQTDSTNLGLKSLSQQYRNIAGVDIAIEQSDKSYEVILPLL